MPNRGQVKSDAKVLLRRSQVSPYLFTLLFLSCVVLLQGSSTLVSGSYVDSAEYLAQLLRLTQPIHLQRLLELPRSATLFITIICSLLAAVLSQGYTLYHLGIRQGKAKGFDTLLDGFTFVGKIVALEILVNLIVLGGFFALFIPGIIFTYRYAFCFYNLCENPEMHVLEAMAMSSRQTRGYKMELFVLDMSFLGWLLLTVLTVGVLNIWVRPWMLQCRLTYFEAAKVSSGLRAGKPQGDEPFSSDNP